MSFLKLIARSACVLAMSAFAVQAAPIQFEVSVEAEFRSVNFGPALSVNSSTGRYNRHSSMVYDDVSSAALNDFAWVDQIRFATGSLQFIYDPDAPSAVAPVFSNCAGLLRSMCSGSVVSLDFDPGNLTSSDGFSFLTRLSSGTLRYTDDRSYTWNDGAERFTTLGYGVQVVHDITSLSITPVPLPPALGFLIAAFGMLFGVRQVSRRRMLPR